MGYSWYEKPVPDDLPVTQVHGVLLTDDGRVLVRIKSGSARLTGGRPERDETWEETLRRETMEEASVSVGKMYYLGYQVPDGEKYAQVRMVALVDEIFPAQPDPDRDSNWIYGRELVPIDDAKVRYTESFGEIGARIIDAAVMIGEREEWFKTMNLETEILNLESRER